jgi:hypothetical protein
MGGTAGFVAWWENRADWLPKPFRVRISGILGDLPACRRWFDARPRGAAR